MANDLRPTEVPAQGTDCGYRKMVLKGKKKEEKPRNIILTLPWILLIYDFLILRVLESVLGIVLSALCGLTHFSSSQSYEAVMPLSIHLTDKKSEAYFFMFLFI